MKKRNYDKEVKIKTQFGVIYIESLHWNRNNSCDREEEDRIKVYDSNHNYMDYWSYEILETDNRDFPIEERYEKLLDCYKAKFDSIENFCYNFAIDYEFIGTKKECYGYLLDNYTIDDDLDLDDYEWCNRIGDYYILIREY